MLLTKFVWVRSVFDKISFFRLSDFLCGVIGLISDSFGWIVLDFILINDLSMYFTELCSITGLIECEVVMALLVRFLEACSPVSTRPRLLLEEEEKQLNDLEIKVSEN